MNQDLLLADSFQSRFSQLRSNLPASILLTGTVGVGLGTIARQLSLNIEQVIEPLSPKGDIDHFSGSISIEVIRTLYATTRGKSKGQFSIIIDDADRMTIPAQQAFLKLLEEPPASAHFILTSHQPDKLLPTIKSRVQTIHVPQIDQSRSISYLKRQSIDEETIRQLLFVAGGRPSLLHTLSHDKQARDDTVNLMQDARTLLTGSAYDKLAVVYRYNDRSKSLSLIDAALKILSFTVTKQLDVSLTDNINKLIETSERLTNGGNVKLQLARLVVQL